MKKSIFVLVFGIVAGCGGMIWHAWYMYDHDGPLILSQPDVSHWVFQSIDTMKYSRDLAREKAQDPDFADEIDAQVMRIADVGATHIAIATPYDEEFLPFLTMWVDAARRHHLNVWFRGNWSGWEEWFGYPRISKEEHTAKTEQFILEHPGLFEDGDVFSGCPECENGALGDPRNTGKVEEYRHFLITQHHTTSAAFRAIQKNVATNYFSMNGDVARLVMNKVTSDALGGLVTIDHYVTEPQKIIDDMVSLQKQAGGKIVLGEYGAPIPDIHGDMSDEEQAKWVDELLAGLDKQKNVHGMNYWVHMGGDTALWREDGSPRPVVDVLKKYYKRYAYFGAVHDPCGQPVPNVRVVTDGQETLTDAQGYYHFSSQQAIISEIHFVNNEYKEKTFYDVDGDRQFDVHLSLNNDTMGHVAAAWLCKSDRFLWRTHAFLRSLIM